MFHSLKNTHQTSRTFFVSGQAQHALHFGFSVVVEAGDGGGVVTSGDFDSELPIFSWYLSKDQM